MIGLLMGPNQGRGKEKNEKNFGFFFFFLELTLCGNAIVGRAAFRIRPNRSH